MKNKIFSLWLWIIVWIVLFSCYVLIKNIFSDGTSTRSITTLAWTGWPGPMIHGTGDISSNHNRLDMLSKQLGISTWDIQAQLDSGVTLQEIIDSHQMGSGAKKSPTTRSGSDMSAEEILTSEVTP